MCRYVQIRGGAVDQNVGYQGFGSEQLDPIQVQVIPVSSLNVGLNSIISITGLPLIFIVHEEKSFKVKVGSGFELAKSWSQIRIILITVGSATQPNINLRKSAAKI